MQRFMGRTDRDLAKAEDVAQELTSAAAGAKIHHVVEAGVHHLEDDGSEKAAIFVVDEDGLNELREQRADCGWVEVLNTFGVGEEEQH